jgi:outer membrane protein OmpA-like peptidoglycan-associated protein
MYNYETMDLYHQVLNIVGKRLSENEKANITITGCNSDMGPEKNNRDLSRRRAEAVRDFLKNEWAIADNRMKIAVRNQPDKQSNSSTEDGNAENRRVEITSDDWKVVEPVVTTDTLRVVKPPVLRFIPKVNSEAGLASWNLPLTMSGSPIKTYSGETGAIQTAEWKLEKETPEMLKSLTSIEYQLNVKDRASQSASSTKGTIPVTQRTLELKREEKQTDTSFSRYSLILFDFDEAGLNKTNGRISDFIKGQIASNGIVTITGYTDRIGTPEYNQQLSEARAKSTAQSLGLANATVRGVGGTELLYDNNTPEGRFYCRTVNVSVATPSK